jgi:5'-3' exonuclease
MSEHVLVVDGTNNFLRCFVVVPQLDVNGEHVGGVVGFIRSLKSIVRETKPTRVVVVWDGQGGSRYRRGIFADYKAGRKPRTNRSMDLYSPEQSQRNMESQKAKAKQYLSVLGILQVEYDNIEADDAIAYLCRFVFSDVDKTIVSTDRDFYQLVDNKTIVYSPTKKLYVTSQYMSESLKILPENYIYAKAILGDGSDNLEGVGGFGPKTMGKLFPVLGERPTNLEELSAIAREKADEVPKLKKFLESLEHLKQNIQLMQLSSPVISTQAGSYIRSMALGRPEFRFTEMRISLMKDGIQLTDADLFSVFREYEARARGAGVL